MQVCNLTNSVLTKKVVSPEHIKNVNKTEYAIYSTGVHYILDKERCGEFIRLYHLN